MKMQFRNFTKEEFIDAVETSTSVRQVLRKIGLAEAGGNYQTAKRKIKLLGLNTDHFTGMGHLKGKTHKWAKITPLEEILVKDSTYGGNGTKIKKKIIDANLLENKCYECGITDWRSKPVSLELEHINGDRFDNRIENLTILCPNCHSQTPTYRGRNKKKKKDK